MESTRADGVTTPGDNMLTLSLMKHTFSLTLKLVVSSDWMAVRILTTFIVKRGCDTPGFPRSPSPLDLYAGFFNDAVRVFGDLCHLIFR